MMGINLKQLDYSEAATLALSRKPALFIDNEWVGSSGGETLPVTDPSSGCEIGRFVEATDADVDRAVAAARRAFDDGRWTNLPPNVREQMMHRLADLLEGHAGELAELEAIDSGKPRSMAGFVDIPEAVRAFRYMAGWPTKIAGEVLNAAYTPPDAFHSYVRREPVGVVGQIVPWNFPLMMAAQKIAAALAAGCTIVLKPAEQTVITTLRLADFVAQAGFPPGVINIITGNGHTVGDRLVRHPDVDKIAFTGSTEVGKLINRAATDTVKRVTLELGGKSPVIVLPDADLSAAAQGASNAIFYNSGQVCVAGSRIYAHRDVFDSFLEGLTAAARGWVPRPSLDPQGRMGPLVSQEQKDRVLGYIDEGRKTGASVASGGNSPEGDGYYVNPTILVDVKPEMRVVREEIFGPVVVAQRFDDLDDVIKTANDTPFGLAATVWTRDLSAMHRLAAKIKSGTVWGNCHGVMSSALPFGGYKQSGFGREFGRQGVEAYTELKTVIIKL